MKKLMVLSAVMLITSCGFAQKMKESDVPVAVKTAFEKVYPNAEEAEWEKESSNYEVNFEIQDKECSVLLDSLGNLVETEVGISTGELPAIIISYIRQHYGSSKIKEAAVITDANGIIFYEAEVKGKELHFDSHGTFIKEIKE